MKKIIKNGTITNTYYQIACDYCKCEFLFQKEDIVMRNIGFNDYSYDSVRCPYCTELLTFSSLDELAEKKIYKINNFVLKKGGSRA